MPSKWIAVAALFLWQTSSSLAQPRGLPTNRELIDAYVVLKSRDVLVDDKLLNRLHFLEQTSQKILRDSIHMNIDRDSSGQIIFGLNVAAIVAIIGWFELTVDQINLRFLLKQRVLNRRQLNQLLILLKSYYPQATSLKWEEVFGEKARQEIKRRVSQEKDTPFKRKCFSFFSLAKNRLAHPDIVVAVYTFAMLGYSIFATRYANGLREKDEQGVKQFEALLLNLIEQNPELLIHLDRNVYSYAVKNLGDDLVEIITPELKSLMAKEKLNSVHELQQTREEAVNELLRQIMKKVESRKNTLLSPSSIEKEKNSN